MIIINYKYNIMKFLEYKLENKEQGRTNFWGLSKLARNHFRVYAHCVIDVKDSIDEKHNGVFLSGASSKKMALLFDSKEEVVAFTESCGAENVNDWSIERISVK